MKRFAIVGLASVAAIAAAWGISARPERIAITSLDASGPGTLRACAESVGRRVCEFSVAGTIDLASDIVISSPGLSIVGETAPSPGITVIGAGIVIKASDVRISHIRVRPGDRAIGPDPEDRDAFRIESGSRRVVLDHVSASHAVDENMDVWGEGISDITVSNSIISLALNDSIHPKGPHGKGMLVGSESDPPARVAVTGNLFAHNADRNPLVHSAFIANNVIFDWSLAGTMIRGSTTPATPSKASVIGNVYIRADTSSRQTPLALDRNMAEGSKVFIEDNLIAGHALKGADNPLLADLSPWKPRGYKVLPSSEVLQSVLADAGARPWERDEIDAQTVRDAIEGRSVRRDCVYACR
jgi:pectate lyase